MPAQQAEAPSFTTDKILNGASYAPGVFAPDSWVTVYGTNLKIGNVVVVAEGGYPLTLDGTMVTITDSAGGAHAGGLRFVARSTLSFLAPSGIAAGPATLTITNAAGLSGSAAVMIAAVAPGLFAANEDGRGPVVANFLRVMADGSRIEGLSFVTNAIAGTRSNLPIQFGAEGNDVYLSLWGVGFRHGASTNVRIGELDVPVLASVAHSQYLGLDQAVVGPLPHALMDAGDVPVELTVDGVDAKPLTLGFREEPAPDATLTYEITENISEVERLIIHRNTLQWEHVESPADPEEGRSTFGTGIETSFDGRKGMSARWRPLWSGRVPTMPGERSSVFTELFPALPAREASVTISRRRRFDDQMNPIPPRGEVRVVEAPTAANDYTLILEFDDRAAPEEGGLDVRVRISPLP